MAVKFPYTRTPKGAIHPLTVGTASDMGMDDADGKWVVQCDDHATLVHVDTQATALGLTALDFCDFCRDEAKADAHVTPEAKVKAENERVLAEIAAAEAAEADEAPADDTDAHAEAVIAAAEQVVADHAVETSAEHAAILAEIADATDHTVRDAAIVKGALAGIPRKTLAETAGLVRVGRIIREAGAGTPRAGRVSEYTKGYRAAVADVAEIVESGRNVKERVAAWVADHTDTPVNA